MGLNIIEKKKGSDKLDKGECNIDGDLFNIAEKRRVTKLNLKYRRENKRNQKETYNVNKINFWKGK